VLARSLRFIAIAALILSVQAGASAQQVWVLPSKLSYVKFLQRTMSLAVFISEAQQFCGDNQVVVLLEDPSSPRFGKIFGKNFTGLGSEKRKNLVAVAQCNGVGIAATVILAEP